MQERFGLDKIKSLVQLFRAVQQTVLKEETPREEAGTQLAEEPVAEVGKIDDNKSTPGESR